MGAGSTPGTGPGRVQGFSDQLSQLHFTKAGTGSTKGSVFVPGWEVHLAMLLGTRVSGGVWLRIAAAPRAQSQRVT